MSGNMSLLQLINAAKDRADMVNSRIVSDTIWRDYINSAKDELHDLLISAYGEDYFLSFAEFNLTSGSSSYPLPPDFYKLKGVDKKVDAENYIPLKKFEFAHRNRHSYYSPYYYDGFHIRYRYRVVGDSIMFTPVPDSSETIRMLSGLISE